MAGYSRGTLQESETPHITIDPGVVAYIQKRGCDFRVCTSCGGPVLLPVNIKPPKKSDLLVKVADHTLFVSVHQAPYLDTIGTDMIPFYDDPEDFCEL